MTTPDRIVGEGTVAIVEDDEGFRLLLEEELRSHNLDVVFVAESVDTATEALKQRFESMGALKLDLLLLDKELGNKTGDEVANFARELAGDEVHIVSMSSYDTEEGNIKGMDLKLRKSAEVIGHYALGYLLDHVNSGKSETSSYPATKSDE